MVSDVVTAVAPEITAGAAGKHAGMSTAPDGLSVTAQLNATVPENPPVGVTVMVEMPFAPGDAMLTAVLLTVKLGSAGRVLGVTGEVPNHRMLREQAGISYAPSVIT